MQKRQTRFMPIAKPQTVGGCGPGDKRKMRQAAHSAIAQMTLTNELAEIIGKVMLTKLTTRQDALQALCDFDQEYRAAISKQA